MNSKEQIIKEKRLIEATKKNFYGATGKFAIITKYLGHPIMQQGSPYFSESTLEDPYDDYDDETMPTLAEDEQSTCLGYFYDGLNKGMHLEIKYLLEETTIAVEYKGYTVYKEIAGELIAFAPGGWEEHVEKIFKVASEKKKNAHLTYLELERQQLEKDHNQFLDKLRRYWGI